MKKENLKKSINKAFENIIENKPLKNSINTFRVVASLLNHQELIKILNQSLSINNILSKGFCVKVRGERYNRIESSEYEIEDLYIDAPDGFDKRTIYLMNYYQSILSVDEIIQNNKREYRIKGGIEDLEHVLGLFKKGILKFKRPLEKSNLNPYEYENNLGRDFSIETLEILHIYYKIERDQFIKIKEHFDKLIIEIFSALANEYELNPDINEENLLNTITNIINVNQINLNGNNNINFGENVKQNIK